MNTPLIRFFRLFFLFNIETAEKGKKVYWRCVVPGCKSNSNVNRHSFPKDVARSEKWREMIKNPELNDLTSDELCYYRVCQLHFHESAYKITARRQVLRDDAVPELNLNLSFGMSTVSRESSRGISLDIGVAVEEKMQVDSTLENPVNEYSDLKAMPSWGDICVEGKSSPSRGPKNSSESYTKKIGEETRNQNRGNYDQSDLPLQEKIHNPLQNTDNSSTTENDSSEEPFMASTSKTSRITRNDSLKKPIVSTSKSSKRRVLLGSVTRKDKLTPVAKRLHVKASNLLKKQSNYVHRLGTMKKRVKSAEKYRPMIKVKTLSSLSKEELALLEMHIRNVHKEARAGEKCLPSCHFH